jgi:hypothetical protein
MLQLRNKSKSLLLLGVLGPVADFRRFFPVNIFNSRDRFFSA